MAFCATARGRGPVVLSHGRDPLPRRSRNVALAAGVAALVEDLAVLVPNDGLVTQRAGDPFFADSFFDVFFALDLTASDPAL